MKCAKMLLVAALTLALSGRAVAQVPNQGIKVHGHWVIEVRNADGTLHARREFENSLVAPYAHQFLAGVLGRDRSVGNWNIAVFGNPPVCSVNNQPQVCSMVEPSDPRPADPSLTFKTLSVTVTDMQLVLRGSFVAPQSFSLTEVRTGNASTPFTFSRVSPEIPIQATQTVSVTVTISFS